MWMARYPETPGTPSLEEREGGWQHDISPDLEVSD
jgi:hypothetical protein